MQTIALTPNMKHSQKVNQTITVEDLLEVKDVQKGIITLANGLYCAVCRVSSPDFYLLGPEGQENVENAAAGALMQLTFDIQFLTTAEALDTRAAVNEIEACKDKLPPVLAELAQARSEYLKVLMRDKAVSARQAYLIVPYATVKGFADAYSELQARIASLTSAFSGARLTVEELGTPGILDQLNHLLNRKKSFRASEAFEQKVITPFYTSGREIT